MLRTRVLVAGGGPVGGTAAYRLAQAGIDVILIDAAAFPPEDLRASTLHPPTLDMLEELGVLDELEVQGLRAPAYHYRNRRSGEVIAFNMGDLADISAHPYRLQCEQFKLARLMAAKLAALPDGRTLFGYRLLGYTQDDSGITATVETATGIELISADYLIGCDGANSTVRKWTGTGFEGFTYPERFLTLSTRYPVERHFEGLAEVNYVSDAEEWCVLLRVPQIWRVLVPTENDVSDATLLSDANKNAVFDRLTDGNGAGVETEHRTLYRVHQRVADRFRHGRVLLAGDAAHLNNPLGGFGMNSGIHDIWNLTGKLRRIILDGEDADALLDQYDRQRRSIAMTFVQKQTIENKQAIEARDASGVSVHERRMAEIASDPERRRGYLLRQSMYESLAQEAAIA